MALLADRLAGVVRSIAVVGIGFDVSPQIADQAVHLMHLILGESLRREYIERASFRLFKYFLEDGQIIAECLAARRWGDQHYIAALPYVVYGERLVTVKLVNISLFQYRLNAGMDPGGEGCKAAFESGDLFHGSDIFHEAPVALKAGKQLLNGKRWHTLPDIANSVFVYLPPFVVFHKLFVLKKFFRHRKQK